jgi:hypothetical protein
MRIIQYIINILASKKATKIVNDFSLKLDQRVPFILILTQYKRNNLRKQLKAISRQSLKPSKVFVFQNGDYIDLEPLRKEFCFELVKSTYNTKYFGRFAFCLSLNAERYIVMDDDILPGRKCFEKYLSEAKRLNSIIGGNGRFAITNENYDKLPEIQDIGIRKTTTEVDFVGHIWVFEKNHLLDMFSILPCTLDTGEDMHLCFSAKLNSGTKSYVCEQTCFDELSDTSKNRLAIDEHASFRKTPKQERVEVELYFKRLGLKFYGE